MIGSEDSRVVDEESNDFDEKPPTRRTELESDFWGPIPDQLYSIRTNILITLSRRRVIIHVRGNSFGQPGGQRPSN